MKRIDLHIHTKATRWELDYSFDFEQLLAHIEDWSLDVIAITNHNVFDLDQYKDIVSRLAEKCTVLPGVEASALGTHLILVGDPDIAPQLPEMCAKLEKNLATTSDSATLEQLEEAFPLLDEFIVIPHYEKAPAISAESFSLLGNRITACETSSLKKALRYAKLRPVAQPFVCFTDYRFGSESADGGRPAYKPCATYVRTDSCSFSAIRRALNDGAVSLSQDGSEALELYPGITSTEGVNLVLGKRSTGKTYTLERVRSLCDDDDVYYIKQGDLVEQSKEKEFYTNLDQKYVAARDKYMQLLSSLTSKAREKGADSVRRSKVAAYLRDLKKHAETKTENDAFSSAKLFNRVGIDDIDSTEEHELIKAIITILNATKYADALEEIVGRSNLIEFLKTVVSEARSLEVEKEAIKAANRATLAVQSKLNQSSVDPYPQPILPAIFNDEAFFRAFEALLKVCWHDSVVADDDGSHLLKYKLVAERSKFTNANDVKRALHLQPSVSLDGITRRHARDYLNALLEIDGVTDIADGLFDLQIGIRDERGSRPSGGQRTECVFLGRLAEAVGKDVVLIDEPESSFDNPFLDEHIASQIRRLSEDSTVFVTTHNQVLGFGLKPNKVFVTSYDDDSKTYRLHSGDMGDESLASNMTDEIPTVETIIDILEAGRDSYGVRHDYYEGSIAR